MLVFDRDGRPYDVHDYEVEGLLASGAYFTEAQKEIGVTQMPKLDSSLVTIYERKTGKAIQRRPVDARELVNSGHYSFESPKAAAAKHAPEPAPQEVPVQRPAALPVFTDENSKEEILMALAQHGVQYRANMSKSDLLNVWNTYVLEQGQK